MALLGLTSAQAKLAKWLVREGAVAVPAGLAWLLDDLAANAEPASPLDWRRFVVTWSRSTPTGTTEDRAQFKIDLINVTSDEVDTTWTSGDYAAVLARLTTMKTSLLPYIAPTQSFAQVIAYRMRFNPTPDVAKPFLDTGQPVYKATLSGTGTSTGGDMPYQVAPTVTFRTAWARHWGRIYLPTPGGAMMVAGRLHSSYLTATSSALKTALGGLHDDGFYPVVPVGQLDKQPFHALLGITAVVTDDVPDIQRRRRPRQTAAWTVA